MKKIVKQMLTGLLAFAMILTMGTPVIPQVHAADSQVEYEIYPTPHDMTYQAGEYEISSEVNVVFEEKIDDATKNKMKNVLESKEKNVAVTEAKVEGKTNVLVGIYNSKGYVDGYVQENYNVNADLFKHYGSYFLASKDNEIVILGLDTDAAFYGITSLKHVFSQMEGSTIRNFEMKDYADVNIRGFIEGYYGIPWSNADRMSLMRFGGDFKMTSYIFAPKDDPYHSAKWREPYPQDKLNEIKEMTEVGNASKCRFVWTIHPFMNGGITEATYSTDIQKIKDKFEQLYNVGVRQFGVLGDDAGNLPRQVVINVMNDLQKWADDKGDVYDLVFCPQGYNHSWQGNYSELNALDAGFPKDVQIFWTGEAVCQPIEQKTLEHFRRHNLPEGKTERRAPLFWLNWPVNDINHGRMLMGKGVQLHTDIDVNDIYGAVTNPMQESEASKVAIFAVADYTWNVKGFEVDQSWADSFKYIEPNAAEELHTLAKHMSNPQPNGHGLVLPESEELQPLLNSFKEKLDSNASVQEDGAALINEMNTIINACDGFHEKSTNEALKEELLPFTNSLKELCAAIRQFVEAQIAIEKEDMQTAFNSYMAGSSSLKTSRTFTKPMINGTPQVVTPGSTHLIPLADKLEKKLSGPISDYIFGDGEEKLVVTAESNLETWYEGNINNIIDGNEKTHAWHNNAEAVGQYYQVNFSKPSTVYGVHILNGASTAGKAQDTFGYAKLKYKVSGDDTWKELNGQEYGAYAERVDVSGIEVKDVVAVRYECSRVGGGGKWPSMREFRVATSPENGVEFTKEVIRTQAGWAVYQGAENNLIDDNAQTSVWYKVRQGGDPADATIKGDYVGVKLSQPITLGKIDILQGKSDSDEDYFKNVKLQYSTNGTEWKDVPGLEPFENTRRIKVDLSDKNIEAQYVRLENQATQKNWIAFREFDVDAKVFYNAKAYTNVEKYKEYGANVFADSAVLDPQQGIELKKDEYIGLKLDRVHEITTVDTKVSKEEGLALEVSKNGYEWSEYKAGENVDARYVRLINKTDAKKTFDIEKFSLKTFEVYEKSLVEDETTFPIGEAASKPATNLFDGDRTTQVIYQASQTQGAKFVYDLGQTIDLDTLKIVCRDSEIDYPRHAKISVSTDGKAWEDVMTIGNQDGENKGEAANEDNINDVLPLHETSYNAKLEEGINKKARFIKFEITRTKAGNDKWVRFQEFEINGGAYMPTVNDPTFESDSLDTRNGKYAYMTDRDLATAFVPENKTGTLNYTVSDNNERNVVKIIQGADAISNATVKVRTWNAPDTWKTLGTLSQTVNEFVMAKDTVLLDVKLEWKDTDLSITELVLSSADVEVPEQVDKSALEALLNNREDTSNWTTESANAYNAAIEAGQKVFDSADADQTSVDNAVAAIQTTIDNKVLKDDVDKSDLTALIDYAKSQQSKEDYKYVVSIVKERFEKALKEAEAVNTKTDATQEEVDAAYDELLNMVQYLDFTGNSDSLKVLVDAAKVLNEKLYTEASWKVLKDALAKAEDVLANGNALQEEIDAAKAALQSAMDNLEKISVDKSKLQNLVNDSKKYEDKLDEYTTATAEIFIGVLKNAKDILAKEDATQEEVDAAYTALQNAIFGLRLIPNKDKLEELIKEAEKTNFAMYTAESGEALKTALRQAKAVFADKDATEKEVAKAEQDLRTAMKGLQAKADAPNKDEKSDVNSAKTGDSVPVMLWMTIAIVAAGGILISKKKKMK